ncbi:MAG: class I SAM-dependent methyltransferase [Rubrivivax sp.]|nr:class I SAM-dependent methyltransferase [Rubrivivax sp.]
MTATTSEKLFTSLVNAVQQYVTPWGVRLRQARRARNVPLPSPGLRARLSALGLDVDRLWWGPMTLFPAKLEYLLQEIDADPPRRVLEVGSGSSTPVLAALANRHGFEVVSLENHEGSARYVRESLRNCPGADRVHLVVTGFRRRRYPDGRRYWWYDVDLGADGRPFDMVLIDGPMGSLVGRNGGLPEIRPYLAQRHRIYLDDANRAHEQACIAEWLGHFGSLAVERPSACRGIAKLAFGAAGVGAPANGD